MPSIITHSWIALTVLLAGLSLATAVVYRIARLGHPRMAPLAALRGAVQLAAVAAVLAAALARLWSSVLVLVVMFAAAAFTAARRARAGRSAAWLAVAMAAGIGGLVATGAWLVVFRYVTHWEWQWFADQSALLKDAPAHDPLNPRFLSELAHALADTALVSPVCFAAVPALAALAAHAWRRRWWPARPAASAVLVVLTGLETKGLEFDAITVVEPQEIEDESSTGRATLYVVLTRATQELAALSRG